MTTTTSHHIIPEINYHNTPSTHPIIPDTAYYDALATTYESAFSHSPGLHAFLQRALAFLPPSAHILDVGCGTGKPVATTLAAAGHTITGIDLSAAMIAQCKAQVPSGTFYQSSMLTWDPPSTVPPLDCVFAVFSLFLLSREELLGSLRRWWGWMNEGETGGRLCLGTILAEDLDTGMAAWDGRGGARGVEMVFMGGRCAMNAFTMEGWREVLREGGFVIEEVRKEVFRPRVETGVRSDDEMHCFIVARRVEI